MKCVPLSVCFAGAANNVCALSGVVAQTFNALRRPCEGGGRVTLVDRAGDRVDVIVTPVIGQAIMEWK